MFGDDVATSCGGLGRYCAPGAEGGSLAVGLVGLAFLVTIVVVASIAWRRRERRRQVTRYEFNERGQIRPIPPRQPATKPDARR